MLIDIITGFGISLLVAGIAYHKKSLDLSGMIAAIIFGTMIYTFGQLLVWSSLIAFFVSSSLLTKLHTKKDEDKINIQQKGRNYRQVIANALVATIFVILYYYLMHDILLIASIVSIASSNSDTWASEIGILSKGKTYSILSFKPVLKGSSGGVSYQGLFASFLGSALIAIFFSVFYGIRFGFVRTTIIDHLLIITLGGYLGSIIDSYLGIAVQAKYQGINSGTIYEVKQVPQESTKKISGLNFIDNDMVNLMSGLLAAIFIFFLFK